ncbi:MAG: DALR anticodon-binding domain-containing protein [Candidatus Helarchaeota archaeon]
MINQSPTKEIVFDWDLVLNFEGDAGPYLQYAYARTAGILREADRRKIKYSVDNLKFVSRLNTTEEINLIKNLGLFPSIIRKSLETYDPSVLAQYTYNLTQLFSKFYTKCPILPISDSELREARLLLVVAFQTVLRIAYEILGIIPLEKM